MNMLLRSGVVILFALILQTAADPNASDEAPYLLEREWEELLKAEFPIPREIRGQRLVTALESKLKTKVPPWWKTLVQSVDVGPEHLRPITDEEGIKVAIKRWRTSGPVRFSGFKRLYPSSDGRTVVVGDDERTLELSPQIAWGVDDDWAKSSRWGISGAIGDDACFVVPFCPTASPGGPSRLFCYDMMNGKLNWKVELVTGVIYSYNHVEFGSYTEVSVVDEKVIVWTGSEIAVTVQAFDFEEGKPFLRFASNSHRIGMR